MAQAKTQKNLTATQKKEAVSLYNSGVSTYTQIASKMHLPYQLINTFMTKWKYEKGILTRSKKVSEPIVEKKIEDDFMEEKDIVMTSIVEEELKFLREYYKNTADFIQSMMLKRGMNDRQKTLNH